jgi:hypothetical protein
MPAEPVCDSTLGSPHTLAFHRSIPLLTGFNGFHGLVVGPVGMEILSRYALGAALQPFQVIPDSSVGNIERCLQHGNTACGRGATASTIAAMPSPR